MAAEPAVFRYRAALRSGLAAAFAGIVVAVAWIATALTGSSVRDPVTAVVIGLFEAACFAGVIGGVLRYRKGFIQVDASRVRVVRRGKPDIDVALDDVLHAEQRWRQTYNLYAIRADVRLLGRPDGRVLLHIKPGTLTQQQLLRFLLTVDRGIIDTGAVPRRIIERRDAILAERRAAAAVPQPPQPPQPPAVPRIPSQQVPDDGR